MRYHHSVLATLVTVHLLAAATLGFAQQAPPLPGDEQALIAVLESDAPLFDKAKACQQLAVLGTKAAVPALAKYLADEQLSHYARFGLEPNPDPSAGAALRAGLDELQGGLLVGVINSLGIRRDEAAVPPLAALLGNSDPVVAAAAAAALGRIASPQSVQTLRDALGSGTGPRAALADACITAADILVAAGKQTEAAAVYNALRAANVPRHVQLAALTGVIRTGGEEALTLLVAQLQAEDEALFGVALSMAHELPGKGVTEALVAELAKPAPPLAQGTPALTIEKAEYGAQEKWLDVTDVITAACGDNGLSIVASNDIAGDPIGGVPKVLRVSYRVDGESKAVEVPEGERLQVQGVIPRQPRRARIVSVLGARGDRSALPVVLEAARSESWDVRLAALRALAELGDASAVPALLENATERQGPVATAALDSLAKLPGDEVDSMLAAMLPAADGGRKLTVIQLLGRREIASAVPALLKLVRDPDPSIRASSLAALGLTVGPDDLPALVDALVRPPTPDVPAAAKEALKTACQRMPDRAACATVLIDRMGESPAATTDLLELLGVVGGPQALTYVAKSAQHDREAVQDAATRVLGEWMSPDVAPVLLNLAKSGNEKFRVRALRGYIRVPRQLDVPADERLAMCQTALAIATRDEERNLALDALSRCRSEKALALAMSHLANPALKERAAASAVTIAEQILDAQPAIVADAMRQVTKVTEDPELAARAKRAMGRARRAGQ